MKDAQMHLQFGPIGPTAEMSGNKGELVLLLTCGVIGIAEHNPPTTVDAEIDRILDMMRSVAYGLVKADHHSVEEL